MTMDKRKCAIICNDAGGAEIVSSYVRNFLNYHDQVKFCLSGPAVNIFSRKLINVNSISLVEAVSWSDWILCGTSWASGLEWEAIRLAKAQGKFVASYLDHWIDFKGRFSSINQDDMPDEIWVGDSMAEEIAKNEFPGMLIRLVENQYLADIKMVLAKNESNARRDISSGAAKILYVGEPIADYVNKRFGDPNFWGYTERDAIKLFLRKLPILGANCNEVVIRPHPSENSEKYNWVSKSTNLPVRIEKEKDLIEQILEAEAVVGCASMAMVVGILARKKVYSSIPLGVSGHRLPHPEIIYIANL